MDKQEEANRIASEIIKRMMVRVAQEEEEERWNPDRLRLFYRTRRGWKILNNHARHLSWGSWAFLKIQADQFSLDLGLFIGIVFSDLFYYIITGDTPS